jgi:hypothetical protein
MKLKLTFPEDTRRAISQFVDSAETRKVLGDPRAEQALIKSALAVRQLADRRRAAREIDPDVRSMPVSV